MCPPESVADGATDETRQRLEALFRSARAPSLRGPPLWDAIDTLIASARPSLAVRLLEERREDLDPGRAIFKLLDALLAQGGQGRQRAALEALRQAERAGVTDLASIVDDLLRRGTLALAAQLLRGSPDSRLARSLSAEVSAAARATCRRASLKVAPFIFADAIRALQLLAPGDETMAAHARRAEKVLTAQLREADRKSDHGRVAELLIRLARLTPDSEEVLENLARAAERAGRPARALDTLMRLHVIRGDAASFRRACMAALAQSQWPVLGRLLGAGREMGVEGPTGSPGGGSPLDLDTAVRDGAFSRMAELVGAGEVESAVRLGAIIGEWLAPATWPDALAHRLLAASRRRLRLAAAADPVGASRLASAHLSLAPEDLDVARLLARLNLRLRRFAQARPLLEDITERDPHVAADWRDLGAARRELGDQMGADACVVRAWLIEPRGEERAAYQAATGRLAAA